MRLSKVDCLPVNHKNYLIKLKQSGFEPKVIYDIGACVTHWTLFAKRLWPDAKYILFDAFRKVEFLWEGYDYFMGVLSDKDGETVKFYQNNFSPGGNSYYKEIGKNSEIFYPEGQYVELPTFRLDTIVAQKGFPLPDFIKIDVQGSEIDIIKGAENTFKNAKRMIVELQNEEYNRGAPQANESIPIIESFGWKCDLPLFQNNGPDGDYSFVRLQL